MAEARRRHLMPGDQQFSLAVTGGSGFLGGFFLRRAPRVGVRLRVLTRGRAASLPDYVLPVIGDLRDPQAVETLVQGCQIVVHLAYSKDVSDLESEQIATGLAIAARRAGVLRFIHVSTVAVVGKTDAGVITEQTSPKPETAYQRRKLRIEQIMRELLQDHMVLTVLRPSTVFGAGGPALVKIADDLRRESYPIRAIRRALLLSKTLNLVCVENVAEAIWFFATHDPPLPGSFIVSEDDLPGNTYGEITAFLARKLSVRIPPVPDLTFILPILLRLRGRSLVNPHSTFDPQRLLSTGFRRPMALADGLERFAEWYASTYGRSGS